MRLYIAGVRHHDPMGRPRLVSWLKSVLQKENVDPQFIGIEYDQSFAQSMIRQRAKFCGELAAVFPGETQETYIQLAQALCFEADTHSGLFTNIQALWLDPNRQANQMSILSVASYRQTVLMQYKNWLDQVPESELTGNILQDISVGAWSGTDALDQDILDRDKQFAATVLSRIENPDARWAILILGSTHVQDRENSTVDILQKAGIECIVTILDATHPIQETN